MSDTAIVKIEEAVNNAAELFARLAGTVLRYGGHDSDCAATGINWDKGSCDCGWAAACAKLGINDETSGMPAPKWDGEERWTGGQRVDIGMVLELTATHSPESRATWLVACDYRVIDTRHCTVARVPNGKTGREALREALGGDRDAEWIDEMADDEAGNRFRRVYAYFTGAPLVLELDRETFAAFLRAGGKNA